MATNKQHPETVWRSPPRPLPPAPAMAGPTARSGGMTIARCMASISGASEPSPRCWHALRPPSRGQFLLEWSNRSKGLTRPDIIGLVSLSNPRHPPQFQGCASRVWRGGGTRVRCDGRYCAPPWRRPVLRRQDQRSPASPSWVSAPHCMRPRLFRTPTAPGEPGRLLRPWPVVRCGRWPEPAQPRQEPLAWVSRWACRTGRGGTHAPARSMESPHLLPWQRGKGAALC
jgi:hypothetical protein